MASKKKTEEVEAREQVPIRMTNDEKSEIAKAASREGLPLGTWVRSTALKAARGLLRPAT